MRMFILALLGAATPALAMGTTAVPEPGGFGLFALAVAGLIVGRQVSRRPPRDGG